MTAGELGAELERLPGVLAATVFSDAPDKTRVYLAVDADSDTEAIRSTALALLDDHGHGINPDRIHVGTAPRAPHPISPLPSMALDGLDVHRTQNRVGCTVQLRISGRVINGTASEPDTRNGRARAAARATLAAAETTDPDLHLGLHGARHHELFGYPTVTVLIEASIGRSQIPLRPTDIRPFHQQTGGNGHRNIGRITLQGGKRN